MYPQFVDTRPNVVADARFRKALMHAIDRDEMAETLVYGLGTVAHSFLNPNQPLYQDIEARLVRYDYDPRRAAQLIEAQGYMRGADGVFHDAAGTLLELNIMNLG